MELKVIKRDGKVEEFKVSKIKGAVSKCIKENNYKDKDFLNYLDTFMDRFPFYKDEFVDVEKIQDWVVMDLRNNLSEELAESYQDYRDLHSRIRNAKYNKEHYDFINSLVNSNADRGQKENANKDYSQSYVIRDLLAGEESKRFMQEFVLPEHIKKLHKKGVIHVHDMDYRIIPGLTNCCLVNLEDMLENGLVINKKLIKDINSIQVAATVATQIIAAVASSQYGGVSISASHLAPYIRKSWYTHYNEAKEDLGYSAEDAVKLADYYTKKEVRKSVRTINYQLNTLYTSCGQSPFVTIWLNTNETEEYKKENAMLIEEILKQRIEGMQSEHGDWISPAFPKLIYCLSENNVYEGTEFYYLSKLAAECSANRMIPDYISEKVMRQLKEGNSFPAMGCRSFLDAWRDPDNGKYKYYGRLNLGVISINIPYIALESENEEEFLSKLEETARIVADQQYAFAERIAESPTSIAPILWNYGALARLPLDAKIGDIIRKKKGYATISIGYAGVANAVQRFGIDYLSPKGQELGVKILKVLNKVANEYKEKTPYGFSIYGTPAESLTTKFAKALKRFKKIGGCNDKEYVTNSFHVPVTRKIDAYQKIKFESQFQSLSSGGFITYTEMPDVKKNPEAVLNLQKYIYENIMYGEINTTSCDFCHTCKYQGELLMKADKKGHRYFQCPSCGETNQKMLLAFRRLCGYPGDLALGTTVGRWYDVDDREKHA